MSGSEGNDSAQDADTKAKPTYNYMYIIFQYRRAKNKLRCP